MLCLVAIVADPRRLGVIAVSVGYCTFLLKWFTARSPCGNRGGGPAGHQRDPHSKEPDGRRGCPTSRQPTTAMRFSCDIGTVTPKMERIDRRSIRCYVSFNRSLFSRKATSTALKFAEQKRLRLRHYPIASLLDARTVP